MGRHRNEIVTQQVPRTAGAGRPTRITKRPRLVRRGIVLPVFGSAAALAIVLVSVTSPFAQTEAANASVMEQLAQQPTQQLAVGGDFASTVTRDSFTVTKKVVVPRPAPATASTKSGGRAAPAVGVPNPGTAQAIAYDMVRARGWGDDQFSCLVALWKRESGWNVFANNKSSGAYGIPQALPGSKMGSAGADWATNPATQITWGLGYISARYGNPCGAWASSQSKGWY